MKKEFNILTVFLGFLAGAAMAVSSLHVYNYTVEQNARQLELRLEDQEMARSWEAIIEEADSIRVSTNLLDYEKSHKEYLIAVRSEQQRYCLHGLIVVRKSGSSAC